MLDSAVQERALNRSDGKVTLFICMSSGCLFHLSLNLKSSNFFCLMLIKLSDVDLDAILAKEEKKISVCKC